jgi:hypothetical protein
VRRALAGLIIALVVAGFLVPQTAGATTVERHHCREECDGGGDGNGNNGGEYEGGKSGDTDQRGDHNCRNFCFYGIPNPAPGGQQPKGFIPPQPGKIPQQIADFVKLVSDFIQGVVRFAV